MFRFLDCSSMRSLSHRGDAAQKKGIALRTRDSIVFLNLTSPRHHSHHHLPELTLHQRHRPRNLRPIRPRRRLDPPNRHLGRGSRTRRRQAPHRRPQRRPHRDKDLRRLQGGIRRSRRRPRRLLGRRRHHVQQRWDHARR